LKKVIEDRSGDGPFVPDRTGGLIQGILEPGVEVVTKVQPTLVVRRLTNMPKKLAIA
jgi:hypothetical protein